MIENWLQSNDLNEDVENPNAFLIRMRAELGLNQTDFGRLLDRSRVQIIGYETRAKEVPRMVYLAAKYLLDQYHKGELNVADFDSTKGQPGHRRQYRKR